MQVKDIMTREVITVNEDTVIEELVKILNDNKISGVPVVNGAGQLVGIVTEGDLLHKEVNPRMPDYLGLFGGIIFKNIDRYEQDFKKLIALKASEIMSTNVITINKEMDISEAAAIMVKNKIKRLPVLENKKLIGIISRADIIKTLAE